MLRPWCLRTILTLSLLFAAVCLQAQDTYSADFKNVDLKLVLDSLSKNLDLRFSMDPDFVRVQKVERLAGQNKDAGWWLTKIQSEYPLEFIKVGERNFAIRKKEPSNLEVSGRIRDEISGEALPGAVVYILEPGGSEPFAGALSDPNGRFTVKAPPGRVRLLVRYLGYRPDTLKLAGGGASEIEIQLKPADLTTPGIIVTGKSDLPISRGQSDVSLDPRRLEGISVLGEPDVFRTLQWLPGVSATEESASGIYIRGGTPDQNLVLLDDIPIYNTGHFFGMFHAFNADALDKVELHRNGFDVEHGGAVAGMIDITSKPRPTDSLSADLNMNLAATSASVSAPLLNKKAAILLAARRSYNDILNSPFYEKIAGNVFQTGSIFRNEQAAEENPDEYYELDPVSNFADLHARFVVNASPRDQISASLYLGGDAVRYFSSTFEEEEESERITEESLNLRNLATGVRWRRQWSPKVFSEHSLWYSDYRGFFSNQQSLTEDADTLDLESQQDNGVASGSFKNTVHIRFNARHLLKAGLQLSRISSNFSINTQENESIWLDSLSLAGTVASPFLSYSFQTASGLEINPGLRLSWYGPDDEFFLESRLQMRYKLSKGLRLTLNAGTYEQLLNPIVVQNSLNLGTEFLTLPSEDNSLEPTRSNQIALGLSYLKPGLWVEVQGYYRLLNGLQRYTRSFDQETNANEVQDLIEEGEGSVAGLDLFVRGQAGPWMGWASYTLSRVMHSFPDLNNGEPFAADHDHRHELKLVNVIQWKKWEASLTWILASGKPYSKAVGIDTLTDGDGDPYYELLYESINGNRLNAYHRLDLNLSYSFKAFKRAKGQIGISLFNLYNHENVRDRNYTIQFPEEENDPLEVIAIDRELLGFNPNVFLRIGF